MAALLTSVIRFAGPLGVATMQVTFFITFHFAITPPGAWALPVSLIGLGFVGLLAVYGAATSTGLRETLAAQLDSIG